MSFILTEEHWGEILQNKSITSELSLSILHSIYSFENHQAAASQIDPISDLRPVCPNCHAMLHKKNPPYTIDELREIIHQNSSARSSKS